MLTPETARTPPVDGASRPRPDASSTAGLHGRADSPGDPGLFDSAKSLWADLRGLVHNHLELAALETQRAAESLASIIIYGLVAGLLLISAWLGVVAAIALALI